MIDYIQLMNKKNKKIKSYKLDRRISKNSNKKRVAYILIALIIVVFLLFTFSEARGYTNFFGTTQEEMSDQTDQNGSDLTDSENEELTNSNNQPDETENPLKQNPQPSSQPQNSENNEKSSVTPVITSAYNDPDGFVYVRSYVSERVEDGGTCSFIFTSGSKTVKESTKGTADASVTSCVIKVNRNKLSGAPWNVKLSYNSSTSQGTSEPWNNIDGM